jgi:MiaB-like tRNA modifying enzyme
VELKNTFYIETYGCSFNQSDSHKIKAILVENGFRLTELPNAKFVIINTCAVKSQTEAKILFRIKSLELKNHQNMIIAGCLPWISKTLYEDILNSNCHIIGITGTESFHEILYLMNQTLYEKPADNDIYKKFIDKQDVKPFIDSKIQPGIVQIAEGCNGMCSYCCTKFARGKLRSFSYKSILAQIDHFIEHGIKEIYLTAQDTGIYNHNNVELKDLLKIIEEKYKDNKNLIIRLGMLNPKYLLKNIDEILNILEGDLFYNFLHIPIQSGSDKILKLMERNYTNSQIRDIFSKIRGRTNFSLSTDIICGFPSENEDDFYKSLNIIEEFKPDIINISKFTARPNTKAKNMKQVNTIIIKTRTEQLSRYYKAYMKSKNKEFLNWRGKILITEHRPDKNYPFFGRNIMYKPVILEKGELFSSVDVKIVGTSFNYLIGEVIR